MALSISVTVTQAVLLYPISLICTCMLYQGCSLGDNTCTGNDAKYIDKVDVLNNTGMAQNCFLNKFFTLYGLTLQLPPSVVAEGVTAVSNAPPPDFPHKVMPSLPTSFCLSISHQQMLCKSTIFQPASVANSKPLLD